MRSGWGERREEDRWDNEDTIPSPTVRLSASTKSWTLNYVALSSRTQLHGVNISSGLSMPTKLWLVLLLVFPLSSVPMVISHYCFQSWRKRSASLQPRPSSIGAAVSEMRLVRCCFGVQPGPRGQLIAGEPQLPIDLRRRCGCPLRTPPPCELNPASRLLAFFPFPSPR